ncbi:MAG: hypothetical protein H8D46_03180 [FCB group bacterium]|nr:hypothetical protein [FCB group bacterium]
MKNNIILIISLILTALIFTGCEKKDNRQVQQGSRMAQQPTDSSVLYGVVTETIDAAGYTYLQLDTGKDKLWAAITRQPIEVGDEVMLGDAMAMHNFRSETLERTFDVIFFAQKINPGSATGKMPAGMGGQPGQFEQGEKHTQAPESDDIKVSDLRLPKGGMRIVDVHANMNELGGKNVIVRGKVVKFTPNVMGKNWLHIQDGTGEQGSHDLTVTTSEMVSVGDVVVVDGYLSLDKDFGFGYHYDLLVEDAVVVVE